ncbi:MAG: aminotransferase class V-fold PLP-dependent enzyme [bacterium]|nr:aminotransferase class V-fold PLP-dependent enzyme [bacterium]
MMNLSDDEFFNELRKNEYARVDAGKHVYLDYTGGNLYAASQVNNHHEMLLANVLGNPHSTNPTSKLATKMVEESRAKVLQFFQAEDYYCVFTPNASGALRIIGESYPFSQDSTFLILADNHNSVNGIREYCNGKKGTTKYVHVQHDDLQIDEVLLNDALKKTPKSKANLFAFPAQSNVSGVKHDLSWVSVAQENGFDVLLDAAAFVPTSKLDLSVVQPDFVSVSFYKIFGYPTGLGCLLIKKSTFEKLCKPWFAGGTVRLVSVVTQKRFLASGHERFEDGTVNYLDIPAVKIGLDYIESIGMDRISRRVRSLAETLSAELGKCQHADGTPIVKIIGPKDFSKRGGTMIMSFFDKNGNMFSYPEIEEYANGMMISIRSGCFCNPGIDEINSSLNQEDMSGYFENQNPDHYLGSEKEVYEDMIKFFGKMRGGTRISVGLATTSADLKKFLEFVESLKNKFVSKKIASLS